MPRFFFHVDDGTGHLDLDGVELPTPDAARLEAVRLAGAILKDSPALVALGEAWHMEVTDGVGTALFRLDIALTEAASGHSAPGLRPPRANIG